MTDSLSGLVGLIVPGGGISKRFATAANLAGLSSKMAA
jgi:hypothetical protein